MFRIGVYSENHTEVIPHGLGGVYYLQMGWTGTALMINKCMIHRLKLSRVAKIDQHKTVSLNTKVGRSKPGVVLTGSFSGL